ncbi:MAG TPA: membrane-bound O-acyltransferase family protein [Lachnospiraceae bacterium]|nr:membrane-bound O-acyltransferase family protein [Lachnospiraceae bacterium]
MLFNSFNFLEFFIVVSLLYFVLPHKLRWVLLLISSYIFYMAWRPELIVLIVFSTFINYIISLFIYESDDQRKRKNLLILSLLINFGLLFVFKYMVFINNSLISGFEILGLTYPIKKFDILLPMGISFYTFQAAAYTIDVYRGEIKPVKNYGKFSLFITFFPQLVAGPIERSKNLLPQFYKKQNFDIDRVIMGLKIMAWGFFKKIVIADRLAVAVNTVYNSCEYYSGLTFVVITVFFSFQIYCDFSGYSDIAVGCAKVLGFDLMCNFDRPFLSKNVREFWSRWHISLSSWFMDYVYIPLGGNRKGKLIQYRNLIITFLISGLWHGANWTFVLWGLLHGMFIVIGNITDGVTKKIKEVLGYNRKILCTWIINLISILCTFGLATFAFILFRANSIGDAAFVIKHLLWGFRSWTTPQYLYETVTNIGLNVYELKMVLIALGVLIVSEVTGGRDIHQTLMKHNAVARIFFYALIVVLILCTGVFYNAGSFIYFQF